jgi:hypothetical protein
MQSAVLTKPHHELTARESQFWEQAELLARQFAAGLAQPLSEEARWGIQSACEWPVFCASHARSWSDWDGRFDSAMLARVDGRELVFFGIGPLLEEGWEPDAVLDGLRDFVRWAGALGHVDGEQAERVCAEVEFAREAWILSVAGNDDDPWTEVAGEGGCPCCAAERAVAPFVGWLRDTTSFSLERSLLATWLAIGALEQLQLTHFAEGAFYRLDITECLMDTYARAQLEEADRSALVAVARAFATFLAHRCGLSGTHKRRMQNEAERWAATPLRAAS